MVLNSPSSDREIRSRAHQLLKDDIGITLNTRAEELVIHERYCMLLRIENTQVARFMAEDIRRIGRSEVYSSADMIDRILSTEGVKIPPFNITDLRPLSDRVRIEDVSGSTAETSEIPIKEKLRRSLLPDKLNEYPRPSYSPISSSGAFPKGGPGCHKADEDQHHQADQRDGVSLPPLPIVSADLPGEIHNE